MAAGKILSCFFCTVSTVLLEARKRPVVGWMFQLVLPFGRLYSYDLWVRYHTSYYPDHCMVRVCTYYVPVPMSHVGFRYFRLSSENSRRSSPRTSHSSPGHKLALIQGLKYHKRTSFPSFVVFQYIEVVPSEPLSTFIWDPTDTGTSGPDLFWSTDFRICRDIKLSTFSTAAVVSPLSL